MVVCSASVTAGTSGFCDVLFSAYLYLFSFPGFYIFFLPKCVGSLFVPSSVYTSCICIDDSVRIIYTSLSLLHYLQQRWCRVVLGRNTGDYCSQQSFSETLLVEAL